MSEVAKVEQQWITIPVDEYESMKRTIDILSNKELMEQIRESRKARKEGRVKPFERVAKELGI
jgi:PHD/YefM family antitoxin component YafN of YafNO toxin-antitoxin module